MASGLGERNIIREIAGRQRAAARGLIKGIGDDCAVWQSSPGRVTLCTMDTLVERIHFDLAWHPPFLLGRKAAGVNLSDIAAMGGEPRFALLSLGISAGCSRAILDDFTAGFLEALSEYDTVLVGGDTVASGERITVSVTLYGEMDEGAVCFRSGARPGDLVWVSGNLGEAACGLELCRRGEATPFPSLARAHLDPRAKVELGKRLAASGLVHAMMDLSDGLATDLAHICTASGVGAEVTASAVPLSPELEQAAAGLELRPLDLALAGGEDYELLFTAAPEAGDRIGAIGRESGIGLSCLGRIIEGEGVVLCLESERREISYQGYEHLF